MLIPIITAQGSGKLHQNHWEGTAKSFKFPTKNSVDPILEDIFPHFWRSSRNLALKYCRR
jgi:hypothetical protein